MIPELGHFALWLALGLSIVLGVVPLAGAQLRRAPWMALARPGAVALFALVVVSYTCLTAAFVVNDFSVLYVAQHSNSALPLPYRIAGVWGGHEGSLLLWILMLVSWLVAVALFSQHLPLPVLARIVSVMALVSLGFLLFTLATSNPFERLFPAAPDGRDLNPLLQDPGMVIHPPMLYMGYVGFAVTFALATAALLEGRMDASWARWSRPWATAAWAFLTLGILLGSWWAYTELGWGGWWFWDPVENASLMPWFAGTALIHSLAVTDKRDALKSWTVLLAIVAFSLSLLGTFLVRSGVLTSVHAFATDPQRGVFILALMLIVVGASFTLFAWRMGKVGLGGRYAPLSREGLLLSNNLLLSIALAAIMLGTLYPLVLDVVGATKISVGPPYFDRVMLPFLLPAAWLMVAGPFARWKGATLGDLLRPLRWAFALALAAALMVPLLHGRLGALALAGFITASWVIFGTVAHALQTFSKPAAKPMSERLRQQPLAYWGMLAAHLGVGVFAWGVAAVKTYEIEQDLVMQPHQTVALRSYRITFVGVDPVRGPNYTAARGVFELTQGKGRVIYLLEPEKRNYASGGQTMTEASIDYGWTRDIYISLGESQPAGPGVAEGSWSVRLYYKPFVTWIWGGCMLMTLGGFLAAADRRYWRRRREAVPAAIAVQPAAPGAWSTGPKGSS